MNEGAKVLVTQTRGTVGRTKRVRDTLQALGLGRVGKKRELTLNDASAGMLRRVRHLIKVEQA